MRSEELLRLFTACTGVSIDTRTIDQGNMYIAIKGDRFDGNAYAEQALAAGAKYCIVNDLDIAKRNEKIYYVAYDGIEVLRRLATAYRKTFELPVIALTGSNGKTTTKELLYRVLATTYKVHATKGNYNNHIGVPLTILSMPIDTEIAIIEMGANHQKEIAYLCEIAQPTVGYITNIGKAHLEGFGGEEGVYKGKKELFDYLASQDKLAIVNDADPKVVSAAQQVKQQIQVKIESLFSSYRLDGHRVNYTVDGINYQTQLAGIYNITNLGVAITLGRYYSVPEDAIHTAITTYEPENLRSQIVQLLSTAIFVDTYNANPTSMAASITSFVNDHRDAKTLLVLGEMLELGLSSRSEHQKILDLCTGTTVVLVGTSWSQCEIGNCKYYEDVESLLADYETSTSITSYDAVLVKGSRSVQLEKILDHVIS